MTSGSRTVLYLSYDGLTDPLGQSQIIPYLIGLSAKGFDFTIISFEKKNAFAKLSQEIRNTLENHDIDWVPLPYHKSPPILSTLYDLWMLSLEASRQVRKKKIRLIHCRSYITSLVGLREKRKRGVKFIFDMRGFWADERVEGGLWNLNNPLFRSVYNYFKKKEREFLTTSDHIISLTHNAKNIIESWSIGSAPIAVIPTCVDTELFNPTRITREDQLAKRSKLGISEDDYIVLYLGSIGTWYMLDEMFVFFDLLCDANPRAKLLVVSQGEHETIRAAAKKHNIDPKKLMIVAASRRDVPVYVSLAQSTVAFIRPTFSKRASFPTKIAEALAMGLPVVINAGVGDYDVIIKNRLGISVSDFNQEEYQSAIAALLRLSASPHYRDFVEKKFSVNQGVLLYERVYFEMTR